MNDRRDADDDVEVSASVSADELTFHEAPEVESRHWGGPRSRGSADSDRSGVPRPVRTGTVYEDVRVDYRLTSRVRSAEDTREGGPGDDPEDSTDDSTEEE